ncbi:Rieske 2Fe-2S domain-containing protein [Zavarzinia sp. CC-PAN008]|uniref:Rieske 2Fe-2S domain-containing protein n=1 Tax=Zavarzinia sp. CC-PAN008 TaxID=3243332 RepID=UPI003F74A026
MPEPQASPLSGPLQQSGANDAGERQQADPAAWLDGLWYYALPSSQVKPGAMVTRTLLGETLILCRTSEGEAFALRDICPHRGIPLSCGSFDGREVTCCYHGWRFDRTGHCTAIPSLTDDQRFEFTKIRTRRFPVAEAQGNLWIWAGAQPDVLPPPPQVPEMHGSQQRVVETQEFPCALDHAVIGLMDPAHGPYVHQSWYWRSLRSAHEKAKRFVPSDLGFTMARHKPSRNAAAYKLLGGDLETEIAFRLPGLRIETITAGRHRFVGLTAVTPIDMNRTQVTQVMYWTMPWLNLLKPVARWLARQFVGQDRAIVTQQQRGLAQRPALLLIDDADTQAKWYYACKREFARAAAERRPFVNPVTEQVLRWRS